MIEILDEERFSRWVYKPRFVDDDGLLKKSFIFLRENINEEGISGQLYDRLSHDVVVSEGIKFERRHKNPQKSEKLVGLAIVPVGDLRDVAILPDTIDVESVPSDYVSEHAEIRFYLDGVLATGNTSNQLLDFYFDEILSLMANGLTSI